MFLHVQINNYYTKETKYSGNFRRLDNSWEPSIDIHPKCKYFLELATF